tara:strand:+ start:263 stop:742 length:480 start_codon:yes stop_codon:yes gene_type:complete
MSYNNTDGLRVITGLDQGAAVDAGNTASSEVKTIVIDIADATALGSSAATPVANDPFIPANSYITGAHLMVTTAFTSGGSATLGIGAYNSAGSAIDADGIDAAIALSAINATTKAVACDGALVGAAIMTGAADAYIKPNYGTAVFTAGAAKLVITYIET